ncbi:MAG: hypothetical protein PVF97_00125 [Desulfobacterales bacterium]
MSDYLSRLIKRSFEHADAILPRPAGLFEHASPTQGPDIYFDHEQDLSDAAHARRQVASRHTQPDTPAARPANPEVPPAADERGERKIPATVLPKRADPAATPIMSLPTEAPTKDTSSSATAVLNDPAKPVNPGRITPPVLHPHDATPQKDDWHPQSDDLTTGGDDVIPSSLGSTDAPAKFIRARQVDVHDPPGDNKRTSSVPAEQGTPSPRAKRLPSPKRTDAERGHTDRRVMEPIVLKPHMSTYIEKTGAAPIEPAKRAEEPPSVNVTIGRVEVRAIMPEAPPARRPRAAKTGPSLSLDEYLKQRNTGQR